MGYSACQTGKKELCPPLNHYDTYTPIYSFLYIAFPILIILTLHPQLVIICDSIHHDRQVPPLSRECSSCIHDPGTDAFLDAVIPFGSLISKDKYCTAPEFSDYHAYV